jgi:hypothetical protein
MEIQANWTKIRDNTVLYNCNGLNSSNPFCTKPFNPNNIENNEIPYYTKCNKQFNFNNNILQNKYYDQLCKNEFGNQYIFDNDKLNLDSIIKCGNNGEKIRCALSMYGDNLVLEDFENYNKTNILCIFFFIILLIILFLFLLKK